MKRITLFLVLAIFSIGFASAGPVINIGIHIGRRNVPDCPGFGFCRATVSLKESGMLSSSTLQVDDTKKALVIGISEKDILENQADKLEYFKGKRSVLFEEDVIFPEEINQKSGSKNSLIIRKGTYPISFSDGVYYLTIPL